MEFTNTDGGSYDAEWALDFSNYEPTSSAPTSHETATSADSSLSFNNTTPNAAAADDPTVFNVVDTDPSLFLDFQTIKDHLNRLCVTADLLRAAHHTVSDREKRLQLEIKELWADNTNLRKRGLRGGTARKQRKVIGKYVSFSEHAAMSENFLQHRIEVEKADFSARTRLGGLQSLAELFDNGFNWVREQEAVCMDMLQCVDAMNDGTVTTEMVEKLTRVDEIVFGANYEAIETLVDLETMLGAFDEEYDMKI